MCVYNKHKPYSVDTPVAYMYVELVLDGHSLRHAVHRCRPLPMQQMGQCTKQEVETLRSLECPRDASEKRSGGAGKANTIGPHHARPVYEKNHE